MATLCVFSLGDYPKGQEGFLEALEDGAIQNINIDESSYSALYNVQNAVFATAKKLGYDVELGAYRGKDFFTMLEMDTVATADNYTWSSLDDVFDFLVEKKKQTEDLRHVQIASSVLIADKKPMPNGGLEALVAMGSLMAKGTKDWWFSTEQRLWVNRSSEGFANYDPNTGSPMPEL